MQENKQYYVHEFLITFKNSKTDFMIKCQIKSVDFDEARDKLFIFLNQRFGNELLHTPVQFTLNFVGVHDESDIIVETI